eukprot:5045368-Pleurochrysis_carterae.AAC.4
MTGCIGPGHAAWATVPQHRQCSWGSREPRDEQLAWCQSPASQCIRVSRSDVLRTAADVATARKATTVAAVPDGMAAGDVQARLGSEAP